MAALSRDITADQNNKKRFPFLAFRHNWAFKFTTNQLTCKHTTQLPSLHSLYANTDLKSSIHPTYKRRSNKDSSSSSSKSVHISPSIRRFLDQGASCPPWCHPFCLSRPSRSSSGSTAIREWPSYVSWIVRGWFSL